MPISSGAGGRARGGRLVKTSGGNRRIYWPNAFTDDAVITSSVSNLAPSDEITSQDSRTKSKNHQYPEINRIFRANSSTSLRQTPSEPLKTFGDNATSKAQKKVEQETISTNRFKSLGKFNEKSNKGSSKLTLATSYAQDTQEPTSLAQANMNSLGGQTIITGIGMNNDQAAARRGTPKGTATNNNFIMNLANSNESSSSSSSNNDNATGKSQLSLSSLILQDQQHMNANKSKLTISTGSANKNKSSNFFIVNQLQSNNNNNPKPPNLNPAFNNAGNSRNSLNSALPASTSSSTAQLTGSQQFATNSASNNSNLNINRRANLKYVKTLIILLMAVDLLITVFVHQFATQDQIPIIFTPYKLRLSLMNLILSSFWFIVLIGAILFDVYFILLIGCLVDIASFVLLLVFSIIHFTYRVDYNSVNLTSLLLVLFSITVLHVYLLVMAALTTYLMIAVKRRKRTGR